MNSSNRIVTAIATLCIGGVMTSCASTRVTGAWKVPAVAQVAPRRVLVLAVLGNTTSRRAVEDEVVRQLGQAGADAIVGYSVSPATGDIPPQRLAQTLAECGADAALVCRWNLLRQTAPRRAGRTSETAPDDRGQLLARGNATLVGGATLGTLWSAATLSDQPGSLQEAAPSFAKALVGEILRDGALSGDEQVALPASGGAGIAASSRIMP
jgi:hypothetical protein